MTTVAEGFPPDLLPQPCWRCSRTVVYATCPPTRGPKGHGSRPFAIELVPDGVVGHVAIETTLIYCGGYICAYETNLPTRYRWHGRNCHRVADLAELAQLQASELAAGTEVYVADKQTWFRLQVQL